MVVELPGFPSYEVFDVPVTTFESMRTAESPKDYFNEHVWGNNFEHDSHWPDLETLLACMGESMTFAPPVTVASKKGDDDTPLHVACVWGDLSAIDLLVAGGADVNARGDLATTPIYNAVSFVRVRSTARLLRAGATVDDENELSRTARQIAKETNDPRLIALFQ